MPMGIAMATITTITRMITIIMGMITGIIITTM